LCPEEARENNKIKEKEWRKRPEKEAEYSVKEWRRKPCGFLEKKEMLQQGRGHKEMMNVWGGHI